MSRLVLGFDTATVAVAVALAEWPKPGESGAPKLIEAADKIAPRAALSELLPAVGELLARHGLTPADLALLAAGRGPGSYTGVRIGLAAAKGLAHGASLPVRGVGTLDAIAWGIARHAEGLLGVVGDAMRGEVYPALFELAAGEAKRLEPDTVAFPEEAASHWAAEVEGPLLLAGDGLSKHASVFEDALGERMTVLAEEMWLPQGEGILSAAWAEGPSSESDAAHLLPVYTRLSDAEVAEGRDGAVPRSGVAGPSGGDSR